MSDEPELKPCPFCGGSDLSIGKFLDGHAVTCANEECNVFGPDGDGKTLKSAKAAWNERFNR